MSITRTCCWCCVHAIVFSPTPCFRRLIVQCLLCPARPLLSRRLSEQAGKSINIQDMKYTDRAFSLAKPLPKGAKAVGDLPVSFFTDALFGLDVSKGWGPVGT